MRNVTLPIAISFLALLATGGPGFAQDKAPPPSGEQVENAKEKHSGPEPNRTLPDQNAKQEPSAKVEGSNPRPEPFWQGKLTAGGAPENADTIPSLVSQRNATDDKLPIVGYALKHLTEEQKGAIRNQLATQKPAGGAEIPAAAAVLGGQVPAAIALQGLQPLPQDLVGKMPELRGVAFMASAGKVLLIDADSRMVVSVL